MKKILIMALTLVCTVGIMPAAAAQAQEASPVETANRAASISLRADEFITYYRTLSNGMMQYRTWNATRGYWVTDWINC